MENTRSIVLDVLMESEYGTSSSGLIRDVLNKYDYLDQRDKAFIKLLFEGTVERRITLDFILNGKSSVKTNKMKPVIRNILRMGVYQLVFTDAPSYAVVKESVNLAGKRGFKGLSGFVNGVLRNIAREIDGAGTKDNKRLDLFLPDPNKTDRLTFFSVRYSMPLPVLEILDKEFGDRTESILSSIDDPRSVSLRFRTYLDENKITEIIEKAKQSNVILNQDPEVPFVWHAKHVGDIRKLPGYEEGYFNIQDVSSCKAVLALGIKKGDRILDTCAAPGGKSILASELAGEEGRVLSCDVSEDKADLIRENISRMGCKNTNVIVRDATIHVPEDEGAYDCVIMDVPCSGLGVMGKKRDIKYNLSNEGLDSLIDLQRKIIDSCVSYVKPGGKLLYSTCTMRRAENEEQALYITDNYDFEIVTEPKQLLPDECEQDGFFYTVLRRIK